jgi:hypothetical protein
MEMAVHVSFVLVVRVLWTKQDGAERTCEMLDVIFLIACGNVAPSESQTALGTNQVQTSEIISFTEWVLFPIRSVDGEKFGGDYITTVHAFEAIKMVDSA